MARHTKFQELIASARRDLFKQYGITIAEDIHQKSQAIQPTAILLDIYNKELAKGNEQALMAILWNSEKRILRDRYIGSFVVYPYEELV